MGFGVCVVKIWDADCADWADFHGFKKLKDLEKLKIIRKNMS